MNKLWFTDKEKQELNIIRAERGLEPLFNKIGDNEITIPGCESKTKTSPIVKIIIFTILMILTYIVTAYVYHNPC